MALFRLTGEFRIPARQPAGQRHQRGHGDREKRARAEQAAKAAPHKRVCTHLSGRHGRDPRGGRGPRRLPHPQGIRFFRPPRHRGRRKAGGHALPDPPRIRWPRPASPAARNRPHASDPRPPGRDRLSRFRRSWNSFFPMRPAGSRRAYSGKPNRNLLRFRQTKPGAAQQPLLFICVRGRIIRVPVPRAAPGRYRPPRSCLRPSRESRSRRRSPRLRRPIPGRGWFFRCFHLR